MQNKTRRDTRLSNFLTFTLIAAMESVALPVWAMFVGWVAFFTGGLNARDSVITLSCVLLGIAFGIGAVLTVGLVVPTLGAFTLPSVVFVVAMIVVSLRAVPVLNNLLCYFLGMITFFAHDQQPSLATFLTLGAAAAFGILAGWISHALQERMAPSLSVPAAQTDSLAVGS